MLKWAAVLTYFAAKLTEEGKATVRKSHSLNKPRIWNRKASCLGFLIRLGFKPRSIYSPFTLSLWRTRSDITHSKKEESTEDLYSKPVNSKPGYSPDYTTPLTLPVNRMRSDIAGKEGKECTEASLSPSQSMLQSGYLPQNTCHHYHFTLHSGHAYLN